MLLYMIFFIIFGTTKSMIIIKKSISIIFCSSSIVNINLINIINFISYIENLKEITECFIVYSPPISFPEIL